MLESAYGENMKCILSLTVRFDIEIMRHASDDYHGRNHKRAKELLQVNPLNYAVLIYAGFTILHCENAPMSLDPVSASHSVKKTQSIMFVSIKCYN